MAEIGEVMLTGAVLRAARALVGMSAAELAQDSGVGERTILRAESLDGAVQMRSGNQQALISALARRGAVLSAGDHSRGPGVWLAHPRQ